MGGRGGRLRAPRDAGGGGGIWGGAGLGQGPGPGQGGGHGQGGAQGQGAGQGVRQGLGARQGQGGGLGQGGQARPRPRAPTIRASMKHRPNTVLMNCHRFQELPTEVQVAEWF